jgi:hypothetical protein
MEKRAIPQDVISYLKQSVFLSKGEGGDIWLKNRNMHLFQHNRKKSNRKKSNRKKP